MPTGGNLFVVLQSCIVSSIVIAQRTWQFHHWQTNSIIKASGRMLFVIRLFNYPFQRSHSSGAWGSKYTKHKMKRSYRIIIMRTPNTFWQSFHGVLSHSHVKCVFRTRIGFMDIEVSNGLHFHGKPRWWILRFFRRYKKQPVWSYIITKIRKCSYRFFGSHEYI